MYVIGYNDLILILLDFKGVYVFKVEKKKVKCK